MGLITDWIQHLISIILLAIVAEMLLPSSKWKRYTKIVISLIIIHALLQPVLTLLKADINSFSSSIPNVSKESNFLLDEKITDYSNKVKQVQNELISQQVVDLMKENVANELASEYKLAIDNIVVSGVEDEMSVSVTVVDIAEEEVQSIKPVSIDLELKNKVDEDIELQEKEGILALLAESWDLQEKDITLLYETNNE